MSGLEIIGVVLAAYPIIANLLQIYKSTQAGKEAISLERRLRVEKTIYTEVLLHLATFAASEDNPFEGRVPEDDFWVGVDVQANLAKRLGPERAQLTLETLHDLNKLLGQIRTEVADKDKILDSARGRIRSKLQRLRASGPVSRIRRLFKELNLHNDILRRLLEDRSLPPCADNTEAPLRFVPYLRRDTSHATDLYNALCNNYHCDCPAPHFANIGLPQSRHYKQMIQTSLGSSDEIFELLFSIEDSKSSVISSESQNDTDSRVTAQSEVPGNVHALSTSVDHTVRSFDNSCTTSWSSLKSIGGSTNVSPTSTTRRRHSSFSVSESQEDHFSQPIPDLCVFVKTLDVDVRVSDTVFDIMGLQETRKKYKLHVSSSTGELSATRSVVCLEDLIDSSQGPVLSRKERISLALRLSHVVLQFYSTPWIDGCWTWRDFCVVKDEEKRDALQLFVTQRFYSTRNSSMNSQDRDKMISAFWKCIGEPILTRLGFALIELALGKRLAEMRDLNSSTTDDPDMLDMITAQTLLKSGQVESQEGQSYEDVVRACLYHQFLSRSVVRDLNSTESNFQNDVERCIIAPLHSIWIDSWGTKH